jgi:NitT/TauT family transport system ATP-binding protein
VLTGSPTRSASSTGLAIDVRAVTKTYVTKAAGSMLAVGPVDFSLRAGEFVSIVGPSGCGKSTLLLIVAGLLSPTHGEVWVGDRLLTKPLTDVGIVFQDDLLLDFRTTLDNVLLQSDIRRSPGRAEAEAAARHLLGQLGLEGAEKKYPHQLSGGMRQRASIARALVHDPPILLMDEPFGALDALTRTQMRRDLEALWLERRKTVLFITHGVEEAVGLSDRVIVMSPSPGRIVEEINVELARPRPGELGDDSSFRGYADRIYAIFQEYGVLH